MKALIGIVALLSLPFLSASAETTIANASGWPIRVDFSSPFDSVPSIGMWPLDVRIENISPKDRSLTIAASISIRPSYVDSSVVTRRRVTAAASSVSSFRLLVPTPISVEAPRNSLEAIARISKMPAPTAKVWIEGVPELGGIFSTEVAHGQFGPYILVGRTRWAHGIGGLKDLFKDSKIGNFSGTYLGHPRLLPDDWRALSGIQMMFLTNDDWSELTAAQRASVRTWVSIGGILVLDLLARPYPTDLEPIGADDRVRIGFGTVVTGFTSIHDAALAVGSLYSQVAFYRLSGNAGLHGVVNAVSKHSSNAVSVALLVVSLYSLCAGPLTWYYLKRRKKLLLLYVTTPLLASFASVMIGLLILFHEGIGGAGARRVFVYLSSDTKQRVAIQDQRSRTGLLLGHSFSIPEHTVLSPKNDAPASPSLLTLGAAVDSSTYSGDIFQDRTLQSQTLVSVEPSRANIRVTLKEETPETLLSSLETPLTHIAVIDDTGRTWQAENIHPGVPATLQPASELSAELSEALELLDYKQSRGLRLGGPPRLRFVALARDASGFMTPTLPSITWVDHTATVFGEVDRD